MTGLLTLLGRLESLKHAELLGVFVDSCLKIRVKI